MMQLTAPPISIGFLDKFHGNTNLAQSIATKREKPTAGRTMGFLSRQVGTTGRLLNFF
jgi:hypothetical protein